MKEQKYLKRRRLRFLPILRLLNLFPGEFPSIHKGEGEDFIDLRPYQMGDDARRINWPYYAKTRKLFITEREVTKNLTIIIVLDLSQSMYWSEQKINTVDAFLEVFVGSLVFGGSNLIGCIGFSAGIENYFPPKAGKYYFAQILKWYLDCIPKSLTTNISKALNFTVKRVKSRSLVLLVSDFLESKNFEKELKAASQKFDFVPVLVQDPKEFAFIPNTRIAYFDVETRKINNVWLTEKLARELAGRENARQEKLKDLFRHYKLEQIFLSSSDTKEVITAVHKFFQRRSRRKI